MRPPSVFPIENSSYSIIGNLCYLNYHRGRPS
uniref:Uncharacterized protein n=1 Tax=Siphoviridae sp. ct6oU4 TaxID=2826299 RepID=A0A8S5QQU8_9CAUD|nr:MAG TPA: hypothetical protein [Siphoviridae sp. ct6oU4]